MSTPRRKPSPQRKAAPTTYKPPTTARLDERLTALSADVSSVLDTTNSLAARQAEVLDSVAQRIRDLEARVPGPDQTLEQRIADALGRAAGSGMTVDQLAKEIIAQVRADNAAVEGVYVMGAEATRQPMAVAMESRPDEMSVAEQPEAIVQQYTVVFRLDEGPIWRRTFWATTADDAAKACRYVEGFGRPCTIIAVDEPGTRV